MAKKFNPRILEPGFFGDFLPNGKLHSLLSIVHHDQTLDFQIRHNQVHIYYRGGKILEINPKAAGNHEFIFDYNYFKEPKPKNVDVLKKILKSADPDFQTFFPIAKQAMDIFLSTKKSEEREYQQLTVRSNNYSSICNSTDYYIIDIEYAHGSSRFDLIALEWKSDPASRKLQKNYKPRLMILEMKYGEGALSGKASIVKHHKDILKFIQDLNIKPDFIDEMENLFLQKVKLGLIHGLNRMTDIGQMKELKGFKNFDDNIDIGYLIADHDPASQKLFRELSSLQTNTAKFLTSNFSGFGLYFENVFDVDAFKNRFQFQIHAIKNP